MRGEWEGVRFWLDPYRTPHVLLTRYPHLTKDFYHRCESLVPKKNLWHDIGSVIRVRKVHWQLVCYRKSQGDTRADAWSWRFEFRGKTCIQSFDYYRDMRIIRPHISRPRPPTWRVRCGVLVVIGASGPEAIHLTNGPSEISSSTALQKINM